MVSEAGGPCLPLSALWEHSEWRDVVFGQHLLLSGALRVWLPPKSLHPQSRAPLKLQPLGGKVSPCHLQASVYLRTRLSFPKPEMLSVLKSL